MLFLYTVTEKKNKEKKCLQINVLKKIWFGLLLYPHGEMSFHPTYREYIVLLACSKILKIKTGFHFREFTGESFIMLPTVSFRAVFWKRWQNWVFYINYNDVYCWYYHMLFHLQPIVLVVQVYCGLLISNWVCLLPPVHLIMKLLFSIFCGWKYEFSSEFCVLCNYKLEHVKPSCWKSGS